MKPVIGIMPLWFDEKGFLTMPPAYTDAILAAGGLPLIFPFTEEPEDISQLADLCDGFLFTGGHDVSSRLYGEEPLEDLVDECPKRDLLEVAVVKKAAAEDKPVLGICRGIQLINAALGGTLIQDLPSQFPSEIAHFQEPPYDEPSHKVRLEKDSPLFALLQAEELAVNSTHHQAVKDPAPGFVVTARATDGVIEGICAPGKRFFWGVQWHPEKLCTHDENSAKIFRTFVDRCRG